MRVEGEDAIVPGHKTGRGGILASPVHEFIDIDGIE